MSSKAKKLVKGSALGMIEFFATALVTLAMTPFIINSLGDAMYGLWIFVGSFLGYYGLMDFGINSAIQRFLSRAIGLNDTKDANKVINTALAIFTIIGFIILLFSFTIAFFVPILIRNITEVTLFRKIILILGLNFAIGFPLRVFSGILTANIRYDLSTAIELIKLALRTTLIIVLLKAGHGIMALALITLVTDISGYIVKYFVVRNLYGYIVLSRKLIDKSKLRPLFGYSVYTFISQIGDQLRYNLDKLVITIFIGLGSVTLYSIAQRLVKYFGSFIISALGIVTPVFSQYEGKGDYDSIRDKFVFLTRISIYLSILIGGTLIIFGNAFIRRWVGEKYLDAYPLLIVLVIPSILALMQNTSTQLLYGISKHKFYALTNSVEGVLNLILSIILVRKIGIMGVAMGTAIPMVLIKLFVQPVYVCRAIKLDIYKYYLSLMGPILKSSAILIVFWLITKNYIIGNYLNISIFICCEIVSYTILVFFIGLNAVERGYLKKIVRRK